MPGHLQKILYTVEAVVEGGREGHARALDGRRQPALPLCQRQGPTVAEEELDPTSGWRWPGAASAQRPAAGTSPTTWTRRERGFRMRRSIGSFKIRAKDTPGSAAPGHHPICGKAGYAPLLPQERTPEQPPNQAVTSVAPQERRLRSAFSVRRGRRRTGNASACSDQLGRDLSWAKLVRS
jgi:hypothetical protein